MAISEDFSAVVAVRDIEVGLNTANLFDFSFNDADISPVDQFIENTVRLNRLWVGSPDELSPELGILLLLGYVSAVESYMRAIIRKLIHCDPYSIAICQKFQLSFGAALHHKLELLPEALLEETVFLGRSDITNAFQKFIGIKIDDKSILRLLDQYEAVSQLRHCCVHRFGKLGVKNAIALGLEAHKELLEKPIKLKNDSISEIADLLFSLVKAINNEVFKQTVRRTAVHQNENGTRGLCWTWNKARDRKKFFRYYIIFRSLKDAQVSPDADELYERFRKVFRVVGRQTKPS